MNDTFFNSLTKLRPMYYHFLDGYINPDASSNLDVIKNLFMKNKIFNGTNIVNNIYLLSINDEFYKFDHLTDDNLSRNIKISSLKNLESEIYKLFEYCIYQTVNDVHATTILFRCIEKKLYIDTFNSGMGIDLHNSKTINGIEHYLPNSTFMFYTNDYQETIDKIISICNISIFYNLLHDNTYKKNANICESIENKQIIKFGYLNESFIRSLEILKNFLLSCNINFNEIDSNLNDILKLDLVSSELHNNDNIYYIKKPPVHLLRTEAKYIYKFDNDINKLSFNYYNILINILNHFIRDDILDENIIDKVKNQRFPDILYTIKNKIILHENNNKLYILPQQSGSCTWFSIYWPIVFYNIYKNDYDGYRLVINHIYKYFYKELFKIFNKENMNANTIFLTEMRILYNKLYDLKFFPLDKNLVFNDNYNSGFKLLIKDDYIDEYKQTEVKLKIDLSKCNNIVTLMLKCPNEDTEKLYGLYDLYILSIGKEDVFKNINKETQCNINTELKKINDEIKINIKQMYNYNESEFVDLEELQKEINTKIIKEATKTKDKLGNIKISHRPLFNLQNDLMVKIKEINIIFNKFEESNITDESYYIVEYYKYCNHINSIYNKINECDILDFCLFIYKYDLFVDLIVLLKEYNKICYSFLISIDSYKIKSKNTKYQFKKDISYINNIRLLIILTNNILITRDDLELYHTKVIINNKFNIL